MFVLFLQTSTLPGTEWKRARRPCHQEIWPTTVSSQATGGEECWVRTEICRGLFCLCYRRRTVINLERLRILNFFFSPYRSASWILNRSELSGSLGMKSAVSVALCRSYSINTIFLLRKSTTTGNIKRFKASVLCYAFYRRFCHARDAHGGHAPCPVSRGVWV